MSATQSDNGQLLTVVIPVFNVEDYVRQCLDSVLGDETAQVQVVVVDDRSTDESLTILEEYSGTDRRVEVVRLPENRGLGGARNAGLRRANGRYVWFVDSDDWIMPGSISRVLRKLADFEPDVLLLGHARVSPDDVVRLRSDEMLSGLPLEFRPSDHPEIFNLSPSAWTKVFRKSLILGSGIDFPAGAYEDIPMTVPMLCRAQRVAALPEIHVCYRQRPGSITSASGRHHLDVITQYDLTLSRVEAATSDPVLHSAVFTAITRQLFELLRSSPMLEDDRRELVAAGAALVRRGRPRRHRSESWLAASREAVLRTGSVGVIDVVRATYDVSRKGVRLAQRAAAVLSRIGRAPRASVRSRAKKLSARLYYRAQLTRPVDEHLAVYASYWGQQILTCNPGAIYRKAQELAPNTRAVWIVDPAFLSNVPPGIDAVEVGTFEYYRALARARYIVSNVNLGDEFVKRAGSTFVQTHHGTPLKAMGIENQALTSAEAGALLRRCSSWDVSVSSNAHSSSVWKRAYPVPVRLLETGYPRNDRLATATQAAVADARRRMGIAEGATSVLYAPTYRDDETEFRSRFDLEAFTNAVGDPYVVLTRAHHRYFSSSARSTWDHQRRIRDVGEEQIEEVLLAADVLITDYSSVMFDFAILDRPIVLLATDVDRYAEVRGLYLDLEATRPGLLVRHTDALARAFLAGEADDADARARRRNFRDRFCAWDDGFAAERVVRAVMPLG